MTNYDRITTDGSIRVTTDGSIRIIDLGTAGGLWFSVEYTDAFAGAGGSNWAPTTLNIFGRLLAAQALANDGDSSPHGLLPIDSTDYSAQHRQKR